MTHTHFIWSKDLGTKFILEPKLLFFVIFLFTKVIFDSKMNSVPKSLTKWNGYCSATLTLHGLNRAPAVWVLMTLEAKHQIFEKGMSELENESWEWKWEFSQQNWDSRLRMRWEFSLRVSISRSRWESRRRLWVCLSCLLTSLLPLNSAAYLCWKMGAVYVVRHNKLSSLLTTALL